jgi:hypothetical protein
LAAAFAFNFLIKSDVFDFAGAAAAAGAGAVTGAASAFGASTTGAGSGFASARDYFGASGFFSSAELSDFLASSGFDLSSVTVKSKADASISSFFAYFSLDFYSV